MQICSHDTIAAIATAPGIGAVGVVRLSGDNAISIAQAVFDAANGKSLSEIQERQLVLGYLKHHGKILDEAMAVVMRAPHSYTAEEVVELHCHGGSLLLQVVLEAILEAGARLANPGEFTQRAFINGRLDLTQAEAVGSLIEARSRKALEISADQLRGRLKQDIHNLRDLLKEAASYLAASIDFSDESDVRFSSEQEIQQRLQQAHSRLSAMTHDAPKGRMMLYGLAAAIIGAPNVGKSSLFNRLLAEERAIVTAQPGTTRDTIEESIQINGLALKLIDSAGIRDTQNPIEQAGIQRSKKASQLADIVLLVLDGSTDLDPKSQQLLKELHPQNTLVLINKQDIALPQGIPWQTQLQSWRWLAISALNGTGIDQLQQQLQKLVQDETTTQYEHALLTNTRQFQAAQKALQAVQQALETIRQPQYHALLAEDINQALHSLGQIVGHTTPDDLLEQIFSRFCIGK